MKSWIKRNSVGIIAVAILALLIIFDLYKCPLKLILGFPCPTCGVTRALLALIRLDITGYLKYNAMAVFLLSVIAIELLRPKIKHKTIADIYVYSVLLINIVYYIIRLIVF